MRAVAVLLAVFCLASVSLAPVADAAPATPELQKLARSASFEVVMRKPEPDRLSYEKPLPLELLPFTERTDKYWSLGSAFALGPNLFVSAAHVIQQGAGSQYGVPSLRDAQGNVYPLDRIVKYSVHQDFAVFTVANPPPVTPLGTNVKPAIDDSVYAVGNALGEGVVIRDGLLTSMTPEDQDGRWKWLRFSAAASPGNSGGPLLDATGKVMGVIIGRSAGENLNYALPISLVLDDAGKSVGIDVRESFKVPVFETGEVGVWKDSLPLPMTYPEFAKRMLASQLAYYETQRRQLLTARLPETFPRGESAKLLAKSDQPMRPMLIKQDADHIWNAEQGTKDSWFDLPDNNGHVALYYEGDVGLFEMSRADTAADDAFYADSRAFGDLLLKAVKLSRPVGSQTIRVTSLGSAVKESSLIDRFGRQWQLRAWPVGFMDIEVVTLALPTPDGYVGMVRYAPSGEHDVTMAEYALLADYFQASYNGSLLQWQAFQKRGLRQPPFDRVKLDLSVATGVKFSSPRFEAVVPASMLKMTNTTVLRLGTQLIADDDKLALDVVRLMVSPDFRGESYVAAQRQAKPRSGAGKDAQERWDRMMRRSAEFSGTLGHDENYKAFWVRGVAGAVGGGGPTSIAADSGALYELTYRTAERVSPLDLQGRREEMMRTFRVLEH